MDGAAAAPAATPVQPVPVAAFAAPNSPSIAEYHSESQPRLFLLPKVRCTDYKSRVFQLLVFRKTRQNICLIEDPGKRGCSQ